MSGLSVSGLPNRTVVNDGSLYIQGMRMNYVDTTHFSVSQGAARDSTNQNDIVLALPSENNGTPITTAFTVNLAANGAGGLDQGTIGASKMYYVFAIASSQNSAINYPPSPQESLAVPPFTTPNLTAPVTQDVYYVQANVMISLSQTPLLPYGFDMYRRIGALRTNSSSQVEPFWQSGYGQNRTMWYQTPVAPGTVGTPATSYATIGALLAVIPQVVCEVIIDVSFAANTAADVLYLAPYGNAAAGYLTLMSAPVVTTPYLYQLRCPCELNAAGTPVMEVDYKCTSASDVAVFLIAGYVDAL